MLCKEVNVNTDTKLIISGKEFGSRLLMGTAGFPDHKSLQDAIEVSGTEIVTFSLRRFNKEQSYMAQTLNNIRQKGHQALPNTAGCYTAKEAVLTAKLAREALETNWIKLEVIGDNKTLLPDVLELLKAADLLIHEGFTVLPYCNDDLITCQKLADIGCAAIMPLGSPIGSGMGILNSYNLEMIRERISIPLILDAGIGTASDAVKALELGFDGVLVNSAISKAQHPIKMAEAMKHACQAGRMAFLAGRIPKRRYAVPSSPKEGVINL